MALLFAKRSVSAPAGTRRPALSTTRSTDWRRRAWCSRGWATRALSAEAAPNACLRPRPRASKPSRTRSVAIRNSWNASRCQELPMRRADLAEAVLSLAAPRERAGSIAGDFLEDDLGVFRFWFLVGRTATAQAWRQLAAEPKALAGIAIRGMIAQFGY